MDYIADLHLHSKYSRAVSRDMTIPIMADYAKLKGIDILSTGDWTHPLWLREIKANLVEDGSGLLKLKDNDSISFLLSVEVSSIYTQGGRTRRIHQLIVSPNIETSEKINRELAKRGANLNSDGRPIVGLSARQVLEIVLGINEEAFIVPCHAWTPWFSLYGSMSGFDSIEECYGELADQIYGIETGLSSDPLMNWQIPELKHRSILSFSDAHSPIKMGREATAFTLLKPNFQELKSAIMYPKTRVGESKIAYTIEFYPEEGKYHYTGHRNCKVVYSPQETREKGVICPVCNKPLTVGVMHRVEELARDASFEEVSKSNPNGVRWIVDPSKTHPPYVKLVPLIEIVAEVLDSTTFSQKTRKIYDDLCLEFSSEFNVLLKVKTQDIQKVAGEAIAQGIEKVRRGYITVSPGYDGEFGIVKIDGTDANNKEEKQTSPTDQLGIDF